MKTVTAFTIWLFVLSRIITATDPSQVGSPSGKYAFKRLPDKNGSVVLFRTKQSVKALGGLKIDDWGQHYPYFESIWSKEERLFTLTRVVHKFSELFLYSIDVDRVIQVELPDFDKLVDPKEKALAAKNGVKKLNPDTRWFEKIQFQNGSMLSFSVISNYSDLEGKGRLSFTNGFTVRIKDNKATVEAHGCAMSLQPE